MSTINEFIKSISPDQDIFKLPDETYLMLVKDYRLSRLKPKEKKSPKIKEPKTEQIKKEEIIKSVDPAQTPKISKEERRKIKNEAILLERAKKIVARRQEKQKLAYSNRQNTAEPKQYKSYRLRANAKRIKFELSQEEFFSLIEMDCTYCGGVGGGIDRKDSKIGYTKENSVPCCWKCNNMKYTHSIDNFIKHVKKIYNFILEKENNG
jgi:hypothetical protein